MMNRRNFLALSSMAAGATALSAAGFAKLEIGLPLLASQSPAAANSTRKQPFPIIDVHMHCYPADMALPALANPITGKPTGLKDGKAHLEACLAEMKRLNIVRGIVSGGDGDRLAAALEWQQKAPDRIIAAAGV